MRGRKSDLTGVRFGRLVAQEPVGRTAHGNIIWRCKCDCGNEKDVSTKDLGHGTSSCGCYARDERRRRSKTHGMSRSNLYAAWRSMVQRCTKDTTNKYENYGGRGIKVCDEWLNSFEAFADWAMANGYTEDHDRKSCSLDRIDVNGDYEPSNCRWASMKTQQRNKRSNVMLTYNGETHCISEWAEIVGMQAQTIGKRLKAGWSVEDALCKPLAR